jgi:hypothetical protein
MPDEARDADGRPPLAAILCLTAGFLCIAAAALLLILRPRPVEEAAAPTPPSPGFDARTRAVVPPVPQSPAPAEPESSPRALYGLSAVVGGLGLALDLVGGTLLLMRRGRRKRRKATGSRQRRRPR